MPNRNCDFCSNGYKNNPKAGYYKLTDYMRTELKLDQTCEPVDFICGEHFEDLCFETSGRLKSGAVPNFFPRKQSLNHDHTYTKNNVEGIEGKILVKLFKASLTIRPHLLIFYFL